MDLTQELSLGTRSGEGLSVASWNVEHFGRTSSAYLERDPYVAIDFLNSQNADVVAIYEVEGRELFWAVMEMMPDYTFFVTEGDQTQEIMVGIRAPLTGFVTQRTEFRAGNPGLRPGVLLTVNDRGTTYSILFLHLKSMSDAKGFGLRDCMLRSALGLRSHLDRAAGGQANYIFCGDLNTMGLDYPYTAHDIGSDDEIRELSRRAAHYTKDMRVLSKTLDVTWLPNCGSEYEPLDLDHVVAASHLKFTKWGGAEVDVRGWPGCSLPFEWTSLYSDHALLYFEVYN